MTLYGKCLEGLDVHENSQLECTEGDCLWEDLGLSWKKRCINIFLNGLDPALASKVTGYGISGSIGGLPSESLSYS